MPGDIAQPVALSKILVQMLSSPDAIKHNPRPITSKSILGWLVELEKEKLEFCLSVLSLSLLGLIFLPTCGNVTVWCELI